MSKKDDIIKRFQNMTPAQREQAATDSMKMRDAYLAANSPTPPVEAAANVVPLNVAGAVKKATKNQTVVQNPQHFSCACGGKLFWLIANGDVVCDTCRVAHDLLRVGRMEPTPPTPKIVTP